MKSNHQPSIEEELIKWLILLVLIVSVLGFIVNFFYDTRIEIWISDIVLNVFYFTAAYLIWFKHKYKLIIPVFIAMLFISTPYLWFLLNGIWGLMPIYVLASITTLTVLATGRQHVFIIGGYVTLITLIVVIELMFPEFTSGYDRQGHNTSFIVIFLIILVSMALILSMLKRKYEKQNNDLKEANEQLVRAKQRIELQNMLLEKQTIEINNINKDLENALKARTGELKELDAQLLKHLFFTNHILKAPLSRILGLLNILDKSKGTYGEEMEILIRLKNTINELKEIMKNIEQEVS